MSDDSTPAQLTCDRCGAAFDPDEAVAYLQDRRVVHGRADECVTAFRRLIADLEAESAGLRNETAELRQRIDALESEKKDLLAIMAADNARLAELEGRIVVRSASTADVVFKDYSPEASFRRAWAEVLAGRVKPVDTLWDEIEGPRPAASADIIDALVAENARLRQRLADAEAFNPWRGLPDEPWYDDDAPEPVKPPAGNIE